MAVPTDHDSSIKVALDQWRLWTLGNTNDRPSLGELLGEGSANRVYELLPMRRQVLRFAYKSHELSVNPSRQEIELWNWQQMKVWHPPCITTLMLAMS